MLNHGNLAMAVYAFMHSVKIQEGRISMSFLPLAHIYQV